MFKKIDIIKCYKENSMKTSIRARQIKEDTLEDKDGDTKIQVEETSGEDKIRFDTAGTQRMIIDETGQIGVGTDSPEEQFHIHGNNATLRLGNGTNSGEHSPKIQLSEAADTNGDMVYGYSVGYNGSTNNFELKRYVNSTTGNIVLTADRGFGNIGIQTESPAADLHVHAGSSGQTFTNVSGLAVENAGSSDTFYVFQTATNGGGKSFSITNGGKVGIGTTSPNSKLDVNGNTIITGSIKSTNLGDANDVMIVGSDNSVTSSGNRLKMDGIGDFAFANNIFVSGSIKTENDISFVDENGTYPTNTAGFFWDLNNDEARIYAKQPSSDAIDFVFKLSDNNHSQDRYMFWIDDYRGGSYDRYPLLMHGGEVLFHMTEASEGVPDGSTSKVRIDSSGRIGMQATSDPSTSTNYAHIYAKDVSSSAEVFVQDEAGNVTQISPHNKEGEWQYFSKNIKTGKVVKINMEKMIRRLEQITGESFMEEWYENT